MYPLFVDDDAVVENDALTLQHSALLLDVFTGIGPSFTEGEPELVVECLCLFLLVCNALTIYLEGGDSCLG